VIGDSKLRIVGYASFRLLTVMRCYSL